MTQSSQSGSKNCCQREGVQRFITTLCILGMILSGIIVTFVSKEMYSQKLPPCKGCDPVKFNHPYMQTIVMFIAEFLCILIWIPQYVVSKKNGSYYNIKPGKKLFKLFPHTFLFSIPTLCDLIGSTLTNIGTYYTLVSIVAMLGQSRVIFVAIFSTIFKDFRHKFDLPQGIGLLCITLGSCVVGYACAVYDPSTGTQEDQNNLLGITVLLLGNVFSALFYITEEIFLRKIQIFPSLAVSQEGAWGLLLHIILMPIYERFEDPFTNERPRPKMENCYAWYYQTKHSPLLIGLIFIYIILVLIFNVTGCETTSRVSSAARSTFNTIKVFVQWVINIAIGREKWIEIGSPIRLVGFIVLNVGVFLYNNVTRFLPYLKPWNKEIYGPVGTQCKKKSKTTATEEVESTEMPATVMLGEQDETAVDGQKQSDAFGNQRKNGNDNRILGEES